MDNGVRTKITEVQKQSRAPWYIVKDDSGAYAVFTEQGSSASQMTAAKVVDVVARLFDCDGQAQYPPFPIGGRSQIAQNSKVRMTRQIDTSSTTQMAEILGKH